MRFQDEQSMGVMHAAQLSLARGRGLRRFKPASIGAIARLVNKPGLPMLPRTSIMADVITGALYACVIVGVLLTGQGIAWSMIYFCEFITK